METLTQSRATEQITSRSKLPSGAEVIASFDSYPKAQAAVDKLSDSKFDVKNVAIVGEGLRFVEQVTGRLTWWKATLRGAGSGALLGLLVGALFGLFIIDPLGWISALLWGLLFGTVIGSVFHLLAYLATGGNRDFSSVGGFGAESFSVLCAPAEAEKARSLLHDTRREK